MSRRIVVLLFIAALLAVGNVGSNIARGFGFASYRKRFGWTQEIPLDRHEKRFPPKRPLLAFVEQLNQALAKRWDDKLARFVPNDDWRLWDFSVK